MRRLLSPGLAEKSCRFRFPKPFFDPANRAPKVAQRPTITISRPYDACHRTAERHQQWQQAYKLWRSIHKRCCFDCNSIWRLVIRNPLGQFWNIIKTSQQQVGDVTQLVVPNPAPRLLVASNAPARRTMSRRRGEFEHRTSIFEGAFRAWSHLGGLDPVDLETKPTSEVSIKSLRQGVP